MLTEPVQITGESVSASITTNFWCTITGGNGGGGPDAGAGLERQER